MEYDPSLMTPIFGSLFLRRKDQKEFKVTMEPLGWHLWIGRETYLGVESKREGCQMAEYDRVLWKG